MISVQKEDVETKKLYIYLNLYQSGDFSTIIVETVGENVVIFYNAVFDRSAWKSDAPSPRRNDPTLFLANFIFISSNFLL